MNDLPLRDIHLPDAISWWPPAIGWWLLPIVILTIIFTVYQLIKFKKQIRSKTVYKKIAQLELQRIRENFNDTEDPVHLLRAISTLLRRIGLSYLPRETVASLTGEQWINQLNSLSQDTFFSNDLAKFLTSAPYMPNADFNPDDLLNICEQWINQLPDQSNKEVNI